jgi:hypothetical protein
MITIANTNFRNAGEVAEHALQVALILRENDSNLNYVNERDFRGLLADSAGYITAVFMNAYGAINQLSLTQKLLTSSLDELRAEKSKEKHKAECKARQEQLNAMVTEMESLEDALASKRNQFEASLVEFLLFHG